MNKLLFLFLLFVMGSAFAQTRPTVYKAYVNEEDMFIVDNLVLSSDGEFFSFASCECGKEYFAKGKWQKKGNKLYLNGYDSTRSFPSSTIKFIEGQPSDSVTLTAFDYFGEPIRNLLIGKINKDFTESSLPEFADKSGRLTLSKKDYSGFFLIYEAKDETGLSGKTNYRHMFEPNTSLAVITIDFAAAGFDRQPVTFTFKSRVFTIKGEALYGQEKKPRFVSVPYVH